MAAVPPLNCPSIMSNGGERNRAAKLVNTLHFNDSTYSKSLDTFLRILWGNWAAHKDDGKKNDTLAVVGLWRNWQTQQTQNLPLFGA